MVKKMMVGLLIAMVGVCFGAKFERNVALNFITTKNFTKLSEYIKTNNEISNDDLYGSSIYVLSEIMIGLNDKSINADNVEKIMESKMDAIKAPKKYYIMVAGYLRLLIPREKSNKIIENVYEKYKAEMPENMSQVLRCYSETKQYDKYLNYVDVTSNKKVYFV